MTIINQPDEPTSLKYTNMNKLLFKEGGQPFYLDDLEFMQESTADVLKAICSGMKLGEKHILLSDPVSTEILGSNTVYTIVGNGYIVIGDEVYPIKPDILTVPTSQPVYWVVVQEKFQNEIFADNSEAQVYERRYVKLSTTYTKSDMYVGRNDVVTFRNKILAIVTDYLDKTIIEKDMKAQLSLSEVVSGKAEIIYRAKQTGYETVYFNILAAANTGTSMIAPEVNGKRRLCTFDSSVKNISGVFSLSMSYADSWDNPQSMIVQLTFDNGNCYIASADGSPLVQMPASTILIEDTLKI